MFWFCRGKYNFFWFWQKNEIFGFSEKHDYSIFSGNEIFSVLAKTIMKIFGFGEKQDFLFWRINEKKFGFGRNFFFAGLNGKMRFCR